MKKNKKQQMNDAEVNMTPMLDIVFIMLIFFIVSSTFIRDSGMDLTDQKSDEKKTEELKTSKMIKLTVCKNKDILIDRRSIDVRSVRANVERKLAEDAGAVVVIESEQEAPTGVLVMTIDQARSAKAKLKISSEHAYCDLNNTRSEL